MALLWATCLLAAGHAVLRNDKIALVNLVRTKLEAGSDAFDAAIGGDGGNTCEKRERQRACRGGFGMTGKKIGRALLWSCATSALLAPAAAMAQSAAADSGGVQEIMVTAQRRAESLQSVPIAVTAITAETIEKSNIRGIEDYFALTPNVSFVTNGSRDRKDLAIRGISNQIDPYTDVRSASFAFYIDEFNVVAGTSNPEVLDLERIELLRGPQGTYFGRNSTGGAINITTHKPTNNWEGQVDAGYSSFNTWKVAAILNVPVVQDKFAIRIAAQDEESDGFIRNINPIGGGNDTSYKTARIIARVTPTDRLTWDTTVSYSNEKTGMRDGVPTGVLTATWRSVYYGGAQGNVADPNGVGFYPNNRDEVNFNRPQSVGTSFRYVSSRAVYDLDNVSITGVVGYLDSKAFNFGDVDGSSFDFFYEASNLVRESLNGELRLQSTDKGAFEWSAGVMAGRDTGAQNQSTYYGRQNKQNQPVNKEITGIYTTASDDYRAAFAQGTYHFTDQLSLVVGGRYSRETIRRHYLNRSNELVTNDTNRAVTFNDFSPRVTLSYVPVENWMLYATVSKGFKAGGTQGPSGQIKETYAPEKVWNYEAGIKGSLWDKRVRFDLSGFYMNWTDIQQSIRFQFLDANNILRLVTGIDNAPGAHSYGIDGSVDVRLNQNLTLNGHAGWLEAYYDKWTNALIDGLVIDASNKRMINAPRFTIGANAEYRRPVFGDFEGFIRPEWNYRSSMLSSTFALRYSNWPFISPSYHNVNLRIGIENEKLRIVAYAQNLFDSNYFNNAYEKAFYSGVQVDPSVRRLGVNVTYKF
ncbi:MAG: hypothetical protein JWM77_3726 [Rhodospirillales bacterium]|nr:hypothetical protein [Rhodospirillales bacterium]